MLATAMSRYGRKYLATRRTTSHVERELAWRVGSPSELDCRWPFIAMSIPHRAFLASGLKNAGASVTMIELLTIS
jgi:hypothetical protein